ncbi:MAG TPA: pilus assembly protein TadG-related protein [Acetobacteraceae bacterium]|nr:pilus assembly protein TadG-related protein [Acetobacteraceae bacterium]
MHIRPVKSLSLAWLRFCRCFPPAKRGMRRLASRRAAVALIVALAAPVLIGATALGTDVAYWYGSREALQTAVDAAAFSAAHFANVNASPQVIEAIAVLAANEAANNQFPGTSQCPTNLGPMSLSAVNSSACEFNPRNLTATITFTSASGLGCYKDGNGNGKGETKCPGNPAYDPAKAAKDSASASPASTSYAVLVTATVPQPIFFSGFMNKTTPGGFQPKIQQQAQAMLRINYTPPPNNTCVTSAGNTGVSVGGASTGLGSFHVGGVSYGACGNADLQLTQNQMNRGYSGYLNKTAFHLSDNGGQLPASNPEGIPGTAPSCSNLYNPANPTINAGDPSSTTNNGMTVYFGPTNSTSSPYAFTPILIEPGSSFCDSNNVCTVPAGAYCGGLTVDPGVTVNFVANDGSENFLILDGNLVVPSSGAGYGSANDPNATFLFGGSSVGSLLQNTQTAVYPGQIQNGTLVYTTTTTTVLQNTGYSASEDQICPGGVVPTGITPSGTPTCPAVTQTTVGGQTNTATSTTQTVQGQTTAAYYNNVGSTPFAQVDTYVTKITFKNGVPVYSQASETTSSGYYNSETATFDLTQTGGQIGLSVNGSIGGNTSATSDAASNDCQASDANNLYSSQTPASDGYSFSGSAGKGYTQQTDTINICGTGPQLVANPNGAEIIASGTLTQHVYLTN